MRPSETVGAFPWGWNSVSAQGAQSPRLCFTSVSCAAGSLDVIRGQNSDDRKIIPGGPTRPSFGMDQLGTSTPTGSTLPPTQEIGLTWTERWYNWAGRQASSRYAMPSWFIQNFDAQTGNAVLNGFDLVLQDTNITFQER